MSVLMVGPNLLPSLFYWAGIAANRAQIRKLFIAENIKKNKNKMPL